VNELERIVHEGVHLVEGPYVLATVVGVTGSSYRRPGARMLVAGDRWVSGCISGGCLEGDVMLRGHHRCRDGPVVVSYDSSTEDGGNGLGCNGVVDVLLERCDHPLGNDAIAFGRACFEHEAAGRLATVIRSTVPGAPVGARVAVGPTVALSRPVLNVDVRTALERAAIGRPGAVEVEGVSAFVERIAPSPQLFLLGSGHDAAPTVSLARSMGFRVTVADRAIRTPSRFRDAARLVSTAGDVAKLGALIDAATEAYVVIMHHHRDADREAVAVALDSKARYIGVLGPARRTRELLDELGRRSDHRVHAPIGLDVGAETPEQIALSIVGELLAAANGRRGGVLRDTRRGLHADVATVVLAAGGSTRLGSPKQLVDLGGEPLVRRVAETCLAAAGGPVGFVLGANSAAVGRALQSLPVALIENERWQEGVASSIRAGVAWARENGCGGLLIALADQPRIPNTHLVALCDAWFGGAPVVATRWRDVRVGLVVGAPAIFDRSRWDALARLEGDRGAGPMLQGRDVVAIDCAAGALDVDTPEDLIALSQDWAGAPA
jgi:xanthine dehydrogenase accessory factor